VSSSPKFYQYTNKAPIILRLERIILGLGLSLREVEELSGVDRHTLYQWFHGSTKCPRFDNIARVAIGLGHATMPLSDSQERPKRKLPKLRVVA
jgi:transcriptional regulator with XRE-family HTH domain